MLTFTNFFRLFLQSCTNNKCIEEMERTCGFCNSPGDSDICGRLLHFRDKEWVHVNCALWSSEVYEEVDGSLQNVGQALSRASKLSCTICYKKGATIGCCAEYCKENYHFACGQQHNISFKEDKSVFCKKHQYYTGGDQNDFSSARTLTIDVENEQKKRPIHRDLRLVQAQIGHLKIKSLGYFAKNSVGSDAKEALIPINYHCSRQFWSTLDPLKKVNYTCRTRWRRKRNKITQLNRVFNHEETEIETIEAELSELKKELQQLESAKMQVPNSKIIVPPFAVSSLWPNLTYQDLHTEPESMQNQNYRRVFKRQRQQQQNQRSSTPIHSSQNSSNNSSPMKSLNKAISNTLIRTPSKLVAEDLLSAIQKEFPDVDLPSVPQDPDVQIIQTWYNQIKKMKVTEVQIQCNLPFTRTNFQMDELCSQFQENDMTEQESDCESDTSYMSCVSLVEEDFYEDDMLSYVIDNLKEQNDLDIIQKILDETPMVEQQQQNNNDGTCLSLESSPDKYAHTLPDPIESIAQLDGNDDEESPKKDFTIGKN